MTEAWSVYLLLCADGTYYCGIAFDPQKRLERHNGAAPGGAKYTRSRRPCVLLASAPCASRGEALKLERAVKALPRKRKLEGILRLKNAHAIP